MQNSQENTNETTSTATNSKRRRKLDANKKPDDTNELTRHNSKKRKTSKPSTRLVDGIDKLKAPGESGRQAILQMKLAAHERYPSAESALSIASLTEQFEREREIERKDPVSFEEAVIRVQHDIDLLFQRISLEEIGGLFFSPISGHGEIGPKSTEEIEAHWMTRWITPFEGQKRGVDEWWKLIGFTGEYLVISSIVSFG